MSDELPHGWVSAKIAEVTESVPSAKPEDSPEKEFGYVDISAIDNSAFTITEVKRFKGKDAPSRARRPIRPDDVLFSNVRTYLRNIALVRRECSAQLCSTGFTVLRPNAAIEPRYLFRYVLTKGFIDRVTPQQTGTHYPATSDRVVMGEHIALPALAEQRRIVAKLETLLGKVDASQQRLMKIPVLLKRFRQSILAAACSGRLTADWREENSNVESAHGLADRINQFRRGVAKPRLVEFLPEEEWPGVVPETWVWVKFGDVIGELRNGVPLRPSIDPPGVSILRISAARPGAVELSDVRYMPNGDEFLPQFALHDRDLLFTRYNGSIEFLGVCGMVRGLGKKTLLYPDKLMRVRFDHDLILPAYAEVFFQAPHVHDRVVAKSKSSAGQNGISGSDIKGQPFALPPLPEQQEIVRRVTSLFALGDQLEARLAAAQRQVDALTPSLLARAFSGQLVPQDPNDEPASALLERICTVGLMTACLPTVLFCAMRDRKQ